MKYQVEFRSEGNLRWTMDREFETIGEAISHATSEALLSTDFEHRVSTRDILVTFAPLEDHV